MEIMITEELISDIKEETGAYKVVVDSSEWDKKYIFATAADYRTWRKAKHLSRKA